MMMILLLSLMPVVMVEISLVAVLLMVIVIVIDGGVVVEAFDGVFGFRGVLTSQVEIACVVAMMMSLFGLDGCCEGGGRVCVDAGAGGFYMLRLKTAGVGATNYQQYACEHEY